MKSLWSLFYSSTTYLCGKSSDIRSISGVFGYGCLITTQIHTHVSKKSLANIKSPLDAIIECQGTVNHNIKRNKNE